MPQAEAPSVFEQLGLPNHRELELKSRIAAQIIGTIRKRGLTQKEAAKLAGVTQSKISQITSAKLNGFSAEKLFSVLTGLGLDVTVSFGKRINKTRPGLLSIAAD